MAANIGAKSRRRIAAFDVCGTLYASNTTCDFIEQHLLKHGMLFRYRVLVLCRTVPLTVTWILVKLLTGHDLLRAIAIALLRGSSMSVLRGDAEEFVSSVLETRKKRPVFALMDALRNEGYDIVLVSASLDIVVEEIGRQIGAQNCISCKLRVKGNRCTGRYALDVMGRKSGLVAEIFGDDIDLAVVTDNREDADLLRLARRRWVVCGRYRKRRRWSRLVIGKVTFME